MSASAASSRLAGLSDEPVTLEDLSAEFGVSRERIRQIEVRAFEKVQKAVQQAAKSSEASAAAAAAGAAGAAGASA